MLSKKFPFPIVKDGLLLVCLFNCLCCYNNEDLEPNANEDYQKKIDLQKIVQNGSEICQTIHLACEFRIYKIVTSEDEEITPKMFIDGSIFLDEKSEKFIVDSEKVLLHYKEKYYGPFTAHFRAIDGKYYLKTDAIENHYIVTINEQI